MTTPDVGGFVSWLGLEFQELTAERVVATCELRPDFWQPAGIVHGGIWAAIVETLTSVGASEWWGDRGQVVGVHNATDFLRAGRTGRVTATATPLHQGRSQQLWVTEIADEGGRLLARGQVRLQNLSRANAGAAS